MAKIVRRVGAWVRRHWVATIVILIVGFIALDDATAVADRTWRWLTYREDLGARLRRECRSVAREAKIDVDQQEDFIRSCIVLRSRTGG